MGIKFAGINILSKDAYKAYEFYKGLGFTIKEVDENLEEKWWCAQFDINGSTLWIWKDHSENVSRKNERMAVTFVVGCENIHESYEEFKLKGYDVSQPEKHFYGGWEMKLTDLDGNTILFLD